MNKPSDIKLFCLMIFACMALSFVPSIVREARWQWEQYQQPGAYVGAEKGLLTAEDAAYLESMEP